MWRGLYRTVLVALGLWLAPAAAWAETIVVGNRASGSFSLIETTTNVVSTVALPGGPNNPETMYFTYHPDTVQLFVGDRGNDRIVVYDALTWNVVNTIPTGQGIFHQWGNTLQNQLWVLNDVSKNFTVINMLNHQVIATVPLPADLAALGTPHDIILDPRAKQVFITVNGIPGVNNDVVLRVSTETFLETGRITPGDNLHVAVAGNNIYVAAQDSNVVQVYNKDSLAFVTSIAVTGAHGAEVNADESIFYTTNITAPVGTQAIFAIDTATNTILGSVDAPFGTPHNVALTPDGTLLYLTHSGGTSDKVSFYTIGPDGVPVFAGSLSVGGNNPFAIASFPTVPEPTTWTLLLTGALPLALGLWRRGRRK